MKKLLTLVLVGLMSLGVLAGCGGGSKAPTKEIEITMGANGWTFEPDVLELTKGESVKVKLVNKATDSQPHSFKIPGLNITSGQVAAGKTAEVVVKADKEGNFEIICDVPGHKEANMVGKLIVSK